MGYSQIHVRNLVDSLHESSLLIVQVGSGVGGTLDSMHAAVYLAHAYRKRTTDLQLGNDGYDHELLSPPASSTNELTSAQLEALAGLITSGQLHARLQSNVVTREEL